MAGDRFVDALQQVVGDYVQDMQPKGFACHEKLKKWLESPIAIEKSWAVCAELADEVHKFAGSAGQTGFQQLSAIAIVLEIGLRAICQAEECVPADVAQLMCLADEFHIEVSGLALEKSTLLTGENQPVFAPFMTPPQILLAGLPVATERILSHVIEQKLGFAWPLPAVTDLASVREGREPNLAIVPENQSANGSVAVVSNAGSDYSSTYRFPVFVYRPTCLREMTAQWGIAVE